MQGQRGIALGADRGHAPILPLRVTDKQRNHRGVVDSAREAKGRRVISKHQMTSKCAQKLEKALAVLEMLSGGCGLFDWGDPPRGGIGAVVVRFRG